jgi:hypothetical protein
MSAVTASHRRTARRPDHGPDRRPDRRPDLKVVRPAAPVPTLVYAVAIILILGAAIFGTVSLTALAAGHAVESRELEQRVAEGEREYAQLVADVASLEDPARIREAALDLGLVPAGPSRHLVLDRVLPADGAVTEAQPGTSADPLKSILSVDR